MKTRPTRAVLSTRVATVCSGRSRVATTAARRRLRLDRGTTPLPAGDGNASVLACANTLAFFVERFSSAHSRRADLPRASPLRRTRCSWPSRMSPSSIPSPDVRRPTGRCSSRIVAFAASAHPTPFAFPTVRWCGMPSRVPHPRPVGHARPHGARRRRLGTRRVHPAPGVAGGPRHGREVRDGRQSPSGRASRRPDPRPTHPTRSVQ